jgi:hypothetical protein
MVGKGGGRRKEGTMSRWTLRACVVLAGIGLGAASIWADVPHGIQGPGRLGYDYYLGTLKGEARLGKNGEIRNDWKFERTGQGTRLRVDSDPTDTWNGWYLCYDPEVKDRAVRLCRTPGPGTLWSVNTQQVKPLDPFDRSLMAVSGKANGWFLAVGDKAESLKDYKGRPFTASRVVLARDAKPLPLFNVFEVAP